MQKLPRRRLVSQGKHCRFCLGACRCQSQTSSGMSRCSRSTVECRHPTWKEQSCGCVMSVKQYPIESRFTHRLFDDGGGKSNMNLTAGPGITCSLHPDDEGNMNEVWRILEAFRASALGCIFQVRTSRGMRPVRNRGLASRDWGCWGRFPPPRSGDPICRLSAGCAVSLLQVPGSQTWVVQQKEEPRTMLALQ